MSDDVGALPRWDVSNVYPELGGEAHRGAVAELDARLDEHLEALDRDGIGGDDARVPDDAGELARLVGAYIDRTNWLRDRLRTLDAFCSAFTTTDTFDDEARRLASELERRSVRLEEARTRFEGWAEGLEGRLDELAARSDTIARHRFFLEETIEKARHRMSEAEELLAGDLAPSGAWAWGKLHRVVTSQIEVKLEREGETETLPMARIRSLASDPDPEVRRAAHEAELEAWEHWQEPLAAAMNGVKGWVCRLNDRRGWEDAVAPSLVDARIDRETLDALLGAMEGALPVFHRYYRAKARALGKERLAWWDIRAPVSEETPTWPFDEARSYIVRQFGTFSERLATFAREAFDRGWIDAEPRRGKVGGAFCMGIPEVKESRILSNYDGTFDQVSTLAHELGHAYHNEVLKEETPLRRRTPMTLAETASIFCETIVFTAALDDAGSDAERLAILETHLAGAAQVVVDILSRYLFERRVFERRDERELTASDLCELMTEAQRETYGDGLGDDLHPYMWAVKPHYYSTGVSFYNYPYAFGLLFGLGLWAVHRERGESFLADYDDLLASTGLGKAADLAGRFAIDLRDEAFWEGGLAEIARHVETYEDLVG